MMKYSPGRRLECGLGVHVHTGILPEKENNDKKEITRSYCSLVKMGDNIQA